MSMQGQLATPQLSLPEPPSGWPIESYPTYAAAQRAVNYLAEEGFPIEHLTIVGHEPMLVERIAGRMTTGRAAKSGAIAGAYWGVFLGLLMALFGPAAAGGVTIVVSAILGATLGAILGLLSFRALGGQRGFVTRPHLVAASYELVVEPKHAEQARNLLAKYALKTGAL